MSLLQPTPPRQHFGLDSEIQSAHFVGICGSGMKPVAVGLLSLGVSVSGSDIDAEKGKQITKLGGRVFEGHAAENLQTPDVLVYSTAISEDNPEIAKALALGIPVVHRSEMLGWFLAKKESILIAGTHGKTTTTTMVSLLLEAANLDPWAFVGGTVSHFGGNLRKGGIRYAVAEADESDGTFLNLPRNHAIITNIEAEHLNFWKTEERIFEGFNAFVSGIQSEGHLVVCVDDVGIRRLIPQVKHRCITYSTREYGAAFNARNIELSGENSSFELLKSGVCLGRVRVGIPGMQNVANAIAAFAMADALGVDVRMLLDTLAAFHGVDRRFTKAFAPGGFLVIDDYAHHPTEITATVAAARMLADERGGRLVAVFQPHRYSRTMDFLDGFPAALAGCDEATITEVYAAGEPPLEGISGQALAAKIAAETKIPTQYEDDFDSIKKDLQERMKNSDTVLLLGAGSVAKLAHLLTSPVHADAC